MSVYPIGFSDTMRTHCFYNAKHSAFRGNNENPGYDYEAENEMMTEPNSISIARLAFQYLNDAQIEEVNRTGMLPENAKFVRTSDGRYIICNNFFGIRAGTRKIPEGYEVKRDFLGFAVVVPKETKGLFIRA